METRIDKPYILRVAEFIYLEICKIKKKEFNLEVKEAIQKFTETNQYNELSLGKFHEKWFSDLKKNNYIDLETNQKIPDQIIKLLEIQRDTMIKQLIKIPKLYETKNNQLIELSNKASNFLWRMCESYELWCKESKQKNLIKLNMID